MIERFPYSPIVARPRLQLPNGARVALWVVPNIEHYEFLPPPNPVRDPWPRSPHPDIVSYGTRDYGNRVGVWRLFDMFDRLQMRATVSLNVAVIDHYPEVFAACEARGWDYMCHGMYNTRYLWNLHEDEERAAIAECVDAFRAATGRTFAGWCSPALSHTLLTPDLVAEAGVRYYCDWVHDDQPAPFAVRRGKLISIPYSVDLNDAVVQRQGHEADEFARMIVDQFDTLYREGEESARVMCIAIHPYNMGQPHRIGRLERALEYICGHEGVWKATGAEIADWYYANYYTDAVRANGAHAG